MSRKDICSEIWQDRLVAFEAGLNTAIRQVRRALDDDATTPTYIETVSRRGYRFLPQPAFSASAPGRNRRDRIVLAGIAALVIAAALFTLATIGDDGDARTMLTDADAQLSRLDSPGYDAYLRGQHALANGDAGGAEAHLRSSIELDPELAPAYVTLARSLAFQRVQGQQELFEAQDLVAHALELEPDLLAAHILDASIALYYFRDRERARAGIDAALAHPSAGASAFVTAAYLHTIEGQHDRALAMIARAHEADPLSPHRNADYGWVHYKARNWDDAERQCRTSVELDPASAFALECIIHVNHSQGDHAEAAEFGLQLMALRGAGERDLAGVRGLPDARVRERAYWEWTFNWAKQNEDRVTDTRSKQGIALTMLGRFDEAVAILNEGFDKGNEPFFAFVAVDPRLDELRGHPGFPALAERSRTPVVR